MWFGGGSNNNPPNGGGGGGSEQPPVTIQTAASQNSTAANTVNKQQQQRRKSCKVDNRPPEEQIADYKEQIIIEKAGKRKLFHSLVKLANELRRTRNEVLPLVEQQRYADQHWYEGGLWRAPAVLPGVTNTVQKSARQREAISLSNLFFNLVIVTAFTRVGIVISSHGFVDINSLLYFAVFWTIWSKEASYSTRFDTTDVSAQLVTLATCFAVLFASLSVAAPVNSVDGTRIMYLAGFVAGLHCLLHVRIVLYQSGGSTNSANNITSNTTGNASNSSNNNNASSSPLVRHVSQYAIFNACMTFLELTTWMIGAFALPTDWPYRFLLYIVAILLALRVPRAFLANDFHASCSKRGVLYILLLGFMLQSIVVVASEFFAYQTPTWRDYYFLGSACLMLFCIKLLYVDDSDTLAEDHALLVNRSAAFFFNVGQFALLLSSTVMGSGLNLLTHDYLAAQAALTSPSKTLVCGGYAGAILSTFFIKSMHLKRIPTDRRNQCLFITAYIIQALVLFVVAGIAAAMAMGHRTDFLDVLMQNDIELLFALSMAAFFLVLMSWLDEGVELSLYQSAADSRQFRVHPFGFWWCLRPEITSQEFEDAMEQQQHDADGRLSASRSLSVLSPLLGSSLANLKQEYESMR